MVYTEAFQTNFASNAPIVDVSSAIARFERLSTDNKLAFLWFAYTKMGSSITPAAPGAARLQFAEGLLNSIKQMSHDEQMQAMRDLVRKVSTPITRSYGVLSVNTKLAFWYQLAEMMKEGTVIPVPEYYQMNGETSEILAAIERLDFSQQITVLRNAVVNMGVDPLA